MGLMYINLVVMERSWTFFGLNRLFAYDYSIFWAMDYDGIQYDFNQRGY